MRRRPPGARKWLAGGVSALVILLLLVGASLQVATPPTPGVERTVTDLVAPFAFTLFAGVGALLTWRRPEHVFGWILLGFAALMTIGGVGPNVIAREGLPMWIVDTTAWLSSWSWVSGIALLGVGITLFPDGRLASRRWRHVLRFQFVAVAMTLALGVALWPHRGPALAFVEDQWPGAGATVGGLALPVVFVGFAAALVSLVVRFRTGSTIVRLQLKWLLFAVTLLVLALVGAALADATGIGAQWVQDLLGMGGLVAFPIAVGIAVLRYRLFEIDRIISRTISWALLTTLLVGVYAVGVLGIGALLPGERSDLLVAGSTLAVAALFRPLRAHVQAVVDERFNRSRHDAQRTIEVFAARLRDEIDVEALRDDLLAAVQSSMEPRTSTLWLAVP